MTHKCWSLNTLRGTQSPLIIDHGFGIEMPPMRGNSSFSLLLFGMRVPIMYNRPVRGSTYAKKTQLDPRNALRRWLSEPLTVYIFMS